jgi:hypothetical protein
MDVGDLTRVRDVEHRYQVHLHQHRFQTEMALQPVQPNLGLQTGPQMGSEAEVASAVVAEVVGDEVVAEVEATTLSSTEDEGDEGDREDAVVVWQLFKISVRSILCIIAS